MRLLDWAGARWKGIVGRRQCWNDVSSLPAAKAEVQLGAQSRAATGEGVCFPTWWRRSSDCEGVEVVIETAETRLSPDSVGLW